MSLSDVIRNIAKTVTNKDELKEKAKDLPLLVVQSTLSAAGQVLLVVDRVKNSIKNIGGKEEREETYDSRSPAAGQVAAPQASEEAKPDRKEPVIFAPRPGAAEPNGAAKTKPDPVIFAPSGEADQAEKTEPAGKAEPAETTQPVGRTEPAETTQPVGKTKPAETTEPVAAPETATQTATPAETKVADKPQVADKPKTAVAKATPKAAPKATPKAAAPKPAKPKAAAPATPAAAAPKAAGDLAEPLPGYDELTVASLRARMRGKTAEQIGDFLAYEQATQARPEVIRMFENRLAKLQAGE